ncbi:GroES-like protein [Calocera viscosa TUFC12733]|uniref:GroES-like protein n=1 Tax=Calocera viscosa (strain TUFC12733) TaxID=1330018 RepID=A0A167NL82_CALVF|nr:GroES-like protein [Calocera viscosa TUFC12733]
MSTKTMHAIMQTAYGEPSKVLKLLTVPLPAFDESSNKLLLRVKAVSINPVDGMVIRGKLNIVWTDPMPAPVGYDVSGVVVKAGKGTGFKEGDEVYGFLSLNRPGSFAEYCTVPARNCALKPTSLSHEEAACLPLVGATAIQALQRHSGPKDTAFIPGGLGGVGSVMLQLAKPYSGFKHTITTASTAKVEVVKQHIRDVDVVIDYKKVEPATVIPAHSCDFVLDQFGKPASYAQYVRKPPPSSAEGKPSIISVSAPPDAKKFQQAWETRGSLPLRIGLNLIDWWTRLWIPGWIHYDSFGALQSASDLKILADLADHGKLKPVIDKVFPMGQAVEAIALAETKPAGKVVIRMSD